jgi:putative transposase
LEAEVEDALGRGYNEHGAAAGAGYRNGYRTGRLKTAEGPIGYAAPQVANREAPFRSALREGLQGRTEALEDLAVELFARGLSTRDIADVFTDGDGRPLLSRAAVSQLSARLWAAYQAFASRDLAEHDIVYLFVDGIAERLRPGQPRAPVLAAWGIARDGRKVLLNLMGRLARGRRDRARRLPGHACPRPERPLAGGDRRCARDHPRHRRVLPRAARQRCLVHRMRNLVVKVPAPAWPEFKERVRACYQAPSRAIARELRDGLVADYERELPNAVACFQDDFEACIAHLRFPITHRRARRTTNMLERLFLEERRRLKIIPNAFGEKAVLKLMYGAMIRAAERWRGLPVTDFERRQLEAIQADSTPNIRPQSAARRLHPSPKFPALTCLDLVVCPPAPEAGVRRNPR